MPDPGCQIVAVDIVEGPITTLNGLDKLLGNELTVTIYSSITSIGGTCFKDHKIKSITLPSSILYITDNAFQDTTINTITIPPKIEVIEANAFNGASIGTLTVSGVQASDKYLSITGNSFQRTTIGTLTFDSAIKINEITGYAFHASEITNIIFVEDGFIGGLLLNCFESAHITNFEFKKVGEITSIAGNAFYNAKIDKFSIRLCSIQHFADTCFKECEIAEFLFIGANAKFGTIGGCSFMSAKIDTFSVWKDCEITSITDTAFSSAQIGVISFDGPTTISMSKAAFKSATITSFGFFHECYLTTLGDNIFQESTIGQFVLCHCFLFTSIEGYVFESAHIGLISFPPATLEKIDAGAFQGAVIEEIAFTSTCATEALPLTISQYAFSNATIEKMSFKDTTYIGQISTGAFQNAEINDLVFEGECHIGQIDGYAMSIAKIANLQFSEACYLGTICGSSFSSSQIGTMVFQDTCQITTITDSAFADASVNRLVFNGTATLGTITETAFGNVGMYEFVFEDTATISSITKNAFLEAKITFMTFKKATSISTMDQNAFQKAEMTKLAFEGSLILGNLIDNVFQDAKIEALDFMGTTNIGAIQNSAFNAFEGTITFFQDSPLTTITGLSFSDATIGLHFKGASALETIDSDSFKGATITMFQFDGQNPLHTIKDCAFMGASFQPDAILISPQNTPNLVTVRQTAFKSTDGIVSITFPSTFTTLGSDSETTGPFHLCIDLETVTFTNPGVTLCACAFKSTPSLSRVIFADDSTLSVIPASCFAGVDGMLSEDVIFYLPNSVETINANAFAYRRNMRLAMPNSTLASVGEKAFIGSDNLTMGPSYIEAGTIIIPSSLQSFTATSFQCSFDVQLRHHVIVPMHSMLSHASDLDDFITNRHVTLLQLDCDIDTAVKIINSASFSGCLVEEVRFQCGSADRINSGAESPRERFESYLINEQGSPPRYIEDCRTKELFPISHLLFVSLNNNFLLC